MKTPIITRDLNKQAPHSPRERFGGFAIMARTVDKCRATLAGWEGEYHYNCPLDNQLFKFKGINGEQFKTAVVTASTYEDVASWLQANGSPKTMAEIKVWSDGAEALSLMDSPDKRAFFIESCEKLGLDPEKATLFDMLEADDHATFEPHAHLTTK